VCTAAAELAGACMDFNSARPTSPAHVQNSHQERAAPAEDAATPSPACSMEPVTPLGVSDLQATITAVGGGTHPLADILQQEGGKAAPPRPAGTAPHVQPLAFSAFDGMSAGSSGHPDAGLGGLPSPGAHPPPLYPPALGYPPPALYMQHAGAAAWQHSYSPGSHHDSPRQHGSMVDPGPGPHSASHDARYFAAMLRQAESSTDSLDRFSAITFLVHACQARWAQLSAACQPLSAWLAVPAGVGLVADVLAVGMVLARFCTAECQHDAASNSCRAIMAGDVKVGAPALQARRRRRRGGGGGVLGCGRGAARGLPPWGVAWACIASPCPGVAAGAEGARSRQHGPRVDACAGVAP